MFRKSIRLVLLITLLDTAWPAFGQHEVFTVQLPDGCQPHLRAVHGGRVDWCDGFIIAEGRGKADGRTENDKLMARRAAETVAARNALLLAMDIQIDGDGCIADLRNAEITLQGRVKGHETIAEEWRPNTPLPEVVVKVRVPLWGVDGAASIVYEGQVRKSLRGSRRRVVLETGTADVSDTILIIDARGTGLRPCLFPAVTGPDGAVLYDVGTLADRRKPNAPTVRYVETTQTHTQLRAEVSNLDRPAPVGYLSEGGAWLDVWPAGGTQLAAAPHFCFPMPDPPQAGEPAPAATRPTSRPSSGPAEGPRRRKVVKAADATGRASTELVLTKEDVEKLSKDPAGAALLRNGQVIVVVDSVAAGIEGRRPAGADGGLLASTRP